MGIVCRRWAAYGFGWRKAGIRHNVVQGPVHLLGPSANRNLYERPFLQGPKLRHGDTETGMNFGQELSPLFLRDTSLKYSSSAFLVEFSVVNLVGFRALDNAASLILILREFSPIKVG